MVTRTQFAYRQAQLWKLYTAIHDREALTDWQWLEARRLIETVLEGLDPREYYNIDVRRGAPQSATWSYGWIAAHYWALRMSGWKDTDAREEVAATWGLSADRVWSIARPRRASSQALVRSIGHASIVQRAKSIARARSLIPGD